MLKLNNPAFKERMVSGTAYVIRYKEQFTFMPRTQIVGGQ